MRVNESNYLFWAIAVKVQMIADRCWRVIDNLPPPERPTHPYGETPESCIENRRLERQYREDMEGHK